MVASGNLIIDRFDKGVPILSRVEGKAHVSARHFTATGHIASNSATALASTQEDLTIGSQSQSQSQHSHGQTPS
jgi:hypothetical protein